jgi:hypothetical protein
MTDHALAIAALVIAAIDVGLSTIALYFLVGIWKDDRLMRIAAEESLAAQREYLGLRRRWYESRTRRKDDKTQPTQPGSTDGASSNGV